MNAPISNLKPPVVLADAGYSDWSGPVDRQNLLPDAQGRNDGQWHRVAIAPGREIELRFARWDASRQPIFQARGQSGAIVELQGFQSFSAAASNAAEKARGGALSAWQPNPLQPLADIKIGGKTLGQRTNDMMQTGSRLLKDVPIVGPFTPKQVVGAYNQVVPAVNKAVAPVLGHPLAVTIPAAAPRPQWLSTAAYAGVQKGATLRQVEIGYTTDGRVAARVPDPKRAGQFRIYTANDLKLSGADAQSIDAAKARVRKLLDPKFGGISAPVVSKVANASAPVVSQGQSPRATLGRGQPNPPTQQKAWAQQAAQVVQKLPTPAPKPVRLNALDPQLGLSAGPAKDWFSKGINGLADGVGNLVGDIVGMPEDTPQQKLFAQNRGSVALFELNRAKIPVDAQGRFQLPNTAEAGKFFAGLVAQTGQAGDPSGTGFGNVQKVGLALDSGLARKYGLGQQFLQGYKQTEDQMALGGLINAAQTLASLAPMMATKTAANRPVDNPGPRLDVAHGAPTQVKPNAPPIEITPLEPPVVNRQPASERLTPNVEYGGDAPPAKLPSSQAKHPQRASLPDANTIDITPNSVEVVKPVRTLPSQEMKTAVPTPLTTPINRPAVLPSEPVQPQLRGDGTNAPKLGGGNRLPPGGDATGVVYPVTAPKVKVTVPSDSGASTNPVVGKKTATTTAPPPRTGTVGAQSNPNSPSRDSIDPEQLVPGFGKMTPEQKVTAIQQLAARPLTPAQALQVRAGKLPDDLRKLLQLPPEAATKPSKRGAPLVQSKPTTQPTPGGSATGKTGNSPIAASGSTKTETPSQPPAASESRPAFSAADAKLLRDAHQVVVLGFSSTGGGHTARSMQPLLTAIDTPSALYGTRGNKVINRGDVILIVKPPHWESDAGNETKQLQNFKAKYEAKGIHVIEVQQDKSLFGFYKPHGPSDNLRILKHFVDMDARAPNTQVPAYGSGQPVQAFDAKDILRQAVQAAGGADKFRVFTDMDPYTADAALAAGIAASAITDQSNHIGLMAPGLDFGGKSTAYLTQANTPGAGNTALIDFDASINRLSRLGEGFKELNISPTASKLQVRRQVTDLILRDGNRLPLNQPVGTAGGILVAPGATASSINRMVYLYLNAYTGPLGKHIQDKLNEPGDNAYKHTLFVVAGGQAVPGHNALNLAQLANADGIVAGGMGTTTEAHQLVTNGFQGKTIVMPVEDQHEQQANAHLLLPAALPRDLPEGMVTAARDNPDLQRRTDDLVENRATKDDDLSGDMQSLHAMAENPNRVTDQPVQLLDGGEMTPRERELNRINRETAQTPDALAMRRIVNAVLPALEAALGNEASATVKMGPDFAAQTVTLKELATTLRNRSKAAELLHADTSGPETRKLLQEVASRLDTIANAANPERRRKQTEGFLQELANNKFVLGY